MPAARVPLPYGGRLSTSARVRIVMRTPRRGVSYTQASAAKQTFIYHAECATVTRRRGTLWAKVVKAADLKVE
jgi:hypothetical protein